MASTQDQESKASIMPIMSGEEMHLHDAVQYWESAQAALADAQLLKAAMGMQPDEAEKIVDVDLKEIPTCSPRIILATSDGSRLACASRRRIRATASRGTQLS